MAKLLWFHAHKDLLEEFSVRPWLLSELDTHSVEEASSQGWCLNVVNRMCHNSHSSCTYCRPKKLFLILQQWFDGLLFARITLPERFAFFSFRALLSSWDTIFEKKKKKGKLRRVNVAVFFFFHVLVIFSLPLGKRHNDKAIENIQINLSTDKKECCINK